MNLTELNEELERLTRLRNSLTDDTSILEERELAFRRLNRRLIYSIEVKSNAIKESERIIKSIAHSIYGEIEFYMTLDVDEPIPIVNKDVPVVEQEEVQKEVISISSEEKEDKKNGTHRSFFTYLRSFRK